VRERQGEKEKGTEPETAGVEDPVASIRFVDADCARAATFGEEVNEVVDVGGAGRRGWWLPVTGCAPL